MLNMAEPPSTTPPRSIAGHGAPRVRHIRYRALVVENWTKIAERRRLGFPLTDIWRELVTDKGGGGMTYKAFRSHVLVVEEVMSRSKADVAHPAVTAPPEAPTAEPPIAAPRPSVLTQSERFQLAREARQREEAHRAEAEEAHRIAKATATDMVDGGEIWMSVFDKPKFRELVALNRKLRSGEVSRAEAEPILAAAKREAWSKRLGIQPEYITEEQMNGRW